MKKKRMIRRCLAIVIMLSLLLANQTGICNILDVYAEGGTDVSSDVSEPQISAWSFDAGDIFPEGELFCEEGVYRLVLAGGDSGVQIPFEDIAALLPDKAAVEITDSDFTANKVLPITGWSCAEYAEDENGKLPYRGEFLFAAQLGTDEEGNSYGMAEGTAPVSVRVVFDAPMTTAAVTASPGTITFNQEWGAQTLAAGTYTINPGVTVTVSGRLEVSGNVTIRGGGTLLRSTSYLGKNNTSGDHSSLLYVGGGTLTLENITIDGNSGNVTAYAPAVYVSSGTLNLNGGAVIQNNNNHNSYGTGAYAAGGIYCAGTLNINGGCIRNCRTSGHIGSHVYDSAGGGVYLKGTCRMTSGEITNNYGSHGGGIYLASGATLEVTGGKISGNSAASGNGNGIFYSTENNTNAKFKIGGDANISDHVFLDISSGTVYPRIISELHYKLTLKCNSTDEGKILAAGEGYTVTGVDVSKIYMEGDNVYSRLDKGNNTIYLSHTPEPQAQWQTSAGGAWNTGSFTEALSGVYSGGTIRMLTDIVFTERVDVTKTVTITSIDPANPCTITRLPLTNYGNITIKGSGKLTLTNIIYDGNRAYINETGATQSLIKVGDGSSDTATALTLGDGCTILNGYKTGGSGVVAVYGSMTMNAGAVIKNCEVTGTGGAVWVSGSGTFTMNGGTIQGCKAGGGGSAVSVDGNCTLAGGTITGNTDTSDKACAVYLRSSGSGSLTLKGVNISGNTYSVYNDGKSVSVAGDSVLSGSIYTTNAVTASGNAVSALTKTYRIKMSSVSSGDTVVTGSTDTKHYELDNDKYALRAGSGGVKLIAANLYSVTYNKNSGTIASESNYTSYIEGVGLTLPTPTRTNYTFGGWYTSSSFSGNAVTAITTTDTGNKTYYAKWTANTYTVTYNKNSGTIASESSYTSYTYGTGLTLPTPTRTGYTFGGWYTSSSFGGDAVTAITTTDTGNKTYYAKWTANTYTVTYNKNSGTIANESSYTSYTYGTGLTLPTPTRTGYTFGGWYTSSSFGGNAVTAITATDIGNKMYYAKWTANTYTVTYNKNSGTIASESSYTSYTYGTGLTLPTPTRTGYTFGGWYTSSSFGGNAVTAITATDTGNKTYYAKWTDDTAPVIGTLRYSYQPASLWQWLIGKKDLVITVPVTEEGSGATEITYTETPEGGSASQKRSTITNGEAKITFDADFRGTIVITCTDQANNTSKSVTVGTGAGATGFIIEDHAPEIACKADREEISTEKYYNAPDITVTVTDDRNSVISGGIASVSWQIGDHTETLKRDFTASMITSAVFTIPAADIPAGETEITITAIDNAGNKTVLVQKISVMTVAEKVAIAKQAVEKALAGITAANDTTKDDIQSVMDTALTNAGISSNDVTVTVGELSKTKATTDAAGSIGGSISIVSKADADVSDSVPVDKTIDRLPVTDEEKVEAAKKVVQEALAGITVTNDTTKEDIQNVIDNALSKAELTDVTVTVEELSKTEATLEEEGSIRGSISIVSKGDADVSGSMPVEKTIDPLPETDEEKVAAAKKVVQEALAGITAANDTTKEDIQNVIDNALSKAGLTDVTVTVRELDKTEATTEETGSISGSITIVSKEDADVSDHVPVGKTIARLPETNEEKVAAAKKIVQETLAGITAANDTTGDDIQNAIDYALGKVGLVDVTVIVGELDKAEATTEEAGSISGSITIVSKENADVSDSVPVGKTIARLPETDEEKVAAAKKVVQEALAGITATNDISKDEIQNVIDNALDKAGLADVTVTVGELDKTEATTKKAGSISGSIDIACGTASGSVPVGKTIAQLPATDAAKVEAAKKVVQEALAGITATNDITRDEVQSVIDHALEKAGLAEDVTVTLDDLARTEATTSEPGSISGNIVIACGTADDSVPVNKTIAQLPKTPEEKAAEAKAAVEEALAGITVTNDTTKEDIQKVIDTALSDAGITDVTVTVEDFVRTDATTSAPGSITGSISIACEDVLDSVPVTGTIEQLPKTEEEKVADAQKVVDVALAGITVTNGTTKDDLQRVIDAALSNAGITDVTVTVADLVKTDATTEEAGSISGSIVIGSREDESVSVRVPITVIIDRLPQDKPDVSDKQDTPAVSDSQPVRAEQPSGSGSVSNAARPGNNRNDSNGSNGRQPQTVEQTGQEAGPSEEADTDKPAPAGEMGQTIPVSLDQDKAVITGESAAAGNVQGMAGTSMGLKLGDGVVIVTVVCQEREYTAGVADTVAVANAILTPEQIRSVNDGETIEIRVDVKDISQNMPASDKEVIESGVAEYRKDMPELTLGMYVDISVFIKVGTGGWDAVTSTREPVEVVIGIPEELREDGREFYIIRSHDGEYAFLEDTDDEPDTITISTDRFSAYAIAYRQTDGREADRCGLCHICPTFLGICCFIWLAVFLAAVLVIVWLSLRRMRKESRKRP